MLAFASLAAIAAFAGAVLVTILGALWYLGRRPLRGVRAPMWDRQKVFLFEGTDLVDASPAAEEIMSTAISGTTDWGRMLSALALRFPDLAERLDEIDDRGTLGVRSDDGTEKLVAATIGNRIRITLWGTSGDKATIRLDRHAFRSKLKELETLRTAVDAVPFPIWRQDADGRVHWANRAYRTAAGNGVASGGSETWPPPPLFSAEALAELASDGTVRRLQAASDSAETVRIYECRAAPLADGCLFSAVAIDATVEAERQLRDFMQTLTKTFSHLHTGLAIFDSQRRLAMFNPALTDLTGLPVDFLASRPTLYNVLDQLRNRRMIPEPKDYGSWRRQIAELEASTHDGAYRETWSLPDNRTYRVTARPHHGGAIAFLVEDISAEITLTRRFRSELELGQAVIDALESAVAVFSPTGTLAMVNSAYQKMWSTEIGDTVDLPTVTEMSRFWMARAATPLWGEIRDFVLHARERTAWEDSVVLGDETVLDCRVIPLAGGSTLVKFLQRHVTEEPRPEAARRA